jgi:hypothetical protein
MLKQLTALFLHIFFSLRTELNNIDNLNPDSYNQVLEIFHEFTETEERQRVLANNLGGVPTQFTGPNGKS